MQEEIEADYAHLATYGNLESQMLSLISNSSSLGGKVAVDNHHEEAERVEQGSCSSFPLRTQWNISSLSSGTEQRGTEQQQVEMERNALNFREWSHEKHPNTKDQL